MINRKKIIENLLQNMYALRHKLIDNCASKKEVVITPSQGFILRFVAKNSPTNIKTITQTLNITSSAATQLVGGLVDKGYLVRQANPDDRRIVTLSLSEKGKKLFKEFKEQGLQKMIELFDTLSDKELEQYANLNEKIIDSLLEK
ncbi:MAG: hypothetical protein PWQ35_205 [Patescibacteria group bacterium]|nr:hypothetical protein [Patescibacteria group bacterium]